ncbi:VOC family protein [Gordonia sp. CPCC 206044]|uniref:VOC family protein n=1 Tax=Gordonia sp. CPCC 206044 TaxID=3140793 RepID=UPI003AF3ED17
MSEPALTTASHGVPCWIDLAAPDPAGSTAFYRELFGWQYTEHRDQVIAVCDGTPVAQISAVPDDDPATTSYWHLYFSSEKFEDVAQRPGTAGGELLSGPFDVDDLARAVTVQDPGGATFSLWEPRVFEGFAADIPGAPVWFELDTADPVAIADFYRDLLDLTPIAAQTDAGAYRMFVSTNGDPVAGVRPSSTRSGWMSYFRTDSLDSTVDAASRQGATVTQPPSSFAPIGRVARVRDPWGAELGLLELASDTTDVDESATAEPDDNAGFPTTLTL